MKAKFKTNPERFNTLNYVDEFETTTKEIMSEAFEKAHETDKPITQQALAKAFCAAHSLAYTAAQWQAIAEALECCSLSKTDVQVVLTRMTRKGYLRSRNGSRPMCYGMGLPSRPVRLYEVNF